MRIESGSIYLAAQQEYSQRREVQEQLRIWVSPDRRSTPEPSATSASAGRAPDLEADAVIDPKLQIAMWLVEFLTGFKASVLHPGQLKSKLNQVARNIADSFAKILNTRSGWGVSYSRQETYQEKEQTVFAAAGEITTQEGRKIDFSLSLNLNREFTQVNSVSFRAGDAQLTDPLVLNFDGAGARLEPGAHNLTYSSLAAGSGYLAIDRNRDAKIQDQELFGPSTGNGFAQLSAYDQDHNGWIDEGDAVFNDLKIWAPGEEQALTTLRDRGIGAIATTSVAAPFSLRDAANQLLGQVNAGGVYLNENGTAGAVQQLDLAI